MIDERQTSKQPTAHSHNHHGIYMTAAHFQSDHAGERSFCSGLEFAGPTLAIMDIKGTSKEERNEMSFESK
jgi:hypothetical protein